MCSDARAALQAKVVLHRYLSRPNSFFWDLFFGCSFGCVLLTSADRNIESSLPLDSEKAWVVTPYWDVYQQLKSVLDMSIDSLREQAETGYQWTLKNYSSTENAAQFNMIIGNES